MASGGKWRHVVIVDDLVQSDRMSVATALAVMAEARSQQAASMTEFHWLGHRFPISNAKTRVAILKAQELEKDLLGPMADSMPADKRLTIFDKIFSAYHEARGYIRADLLKENQCILCWSGMGQNSGPIKT
ncbi:hypothetical protein L6164_012212 [Bauhinia variegata]|uniref:Uncharacterized protein n=1 Tax=Bauhinia variegata TaxID=167791 RepID=A0ACB9P8A4_BAUVA|nr:hypothetical protein L6164_012212 [Bauhinia variegata]